MKDRDPRVLGWIADQYAVHRGQLARILGVRSRSTVKRWIDSRVAEGFVFDEVSLARRGRSGSSSYHILPGWVSLTERGLAAVDRPYPVWKASDHIDELPAIARINDLRLQLEEEQRARGRRDGEDFQWVSARVGDFPPGQAAIWTTDEGTWAVARTWSVQYLAELVEEVGPTIVPIDEGTSEIAAQLPVIHPEAARHVRFIHIRRNHRGVL